MSLPDDPDRLGLPAFDPLDPIKMSNGLDVTLGGSSLPYGRASGMQLWGPDAALGSPFQVQFSIDGFP